MESILWMEDVVWNKRNSVFRYQTEFRFYTEFRLPVLDGIPSSVFRRNSEGTEFPRNYFWKRRNYNSAGSEKWTSVETLIAPSYNIVVDLKSTFDRYWQVEHESILMIRCLFKVESRSKSLVVSILFCRCLFYLVSRSKLIVVSILFRRCLIDLVSILISSRSINIIVIDASSILFRYCYY